MQLQIKAEHIRLSRREHDYIEKKLSTLQRFEARVADSSTMISFHIERSHIKTSDHKLFMEATVHMPHATLRAEAKGLTVAEGVDILEEKLKKQLQRYKEKRIAH